MITKKKWKTIWGRRPEDVTLTDTLFRGYAPEFECVDWYDEHWCFEEVSPYKIPLVDYRRETEEEKQFPIRLGVVQPRLEDGLLSREQAEYYLGTGTGGSTTTTKTFPFRTEWMSQNFFQVAWSRIVTGEIFCTQCSC